MNNYRKIRDDGNRELMKKYNECLKYCNDFIALFNGLKNELKRANKMVLPFEAYNCYETLYDISNELNNALYAFKDYSDYVEENY